MPGVRLRCRHRSRVTRHPLRDIPLPPTAPWGRSPLEATGCARTTRSGAPRPVDPKAHWTWSVRPKRTRGHLCTVCDPRIGSRDEDRPTLARPIPEPEGPATVHARPERTQALAPRQSRTVRIGVGLGSPRGCARPSRSRSSATSDARPRESVKMRPTVDPHDPEMLCPTAVETTSPRPHDPRAPMSPPNPRDRASRSRGGFLCRHRRRRPRHSAAPPSLPARWSAFGTRPRPRSSRLHPASVREPDRMLPPVLLGTSSRQAHPFDPRSQPRRRRRRLASLLGSALHRRFRTTLPVGSGPAASEQAPTRWRSTRAEARARPRNQATREALVRCPDILDAVSPPHSCTTSAKIHGLVVDRAGEPLRRAARPRERCSARPCPIGTRRCHHHRGPTRRRRSEDLR